MPLILIPLPDMQNPQKSTYWKFVAWFLALIIFGIGSLVAFRVYEFRQGERAVQELAKGLEQAQEELYKLQLADTIGGKTPQETLALYIDAVERGDYELASKYFVLEKREEELKSFEGAPEVNIQNYIELLRESADSQGVYSDDGKYFSIDRPILIRMGLYPSGVWKILEI